MSSKSKGRRGQVRLPTTNWNDRMHPRNRYYLNPPHFIKLAKTNPELRQYINKGQFDWTTPQALR